MPSQSEVVENGDGSVTIKYTAPSTYGSGQELPIPLTSLEIYRLGEYDSKPASGAAPFQTVENPEMGATVEFTDPEPTANKQNNWYIKAICALGDGGTKVSGWVGYDVPRAVGNLQLQRKVMAYVCHGPLRPQDRMIITGLISIPNRRAIRYTAHSVTANRPGCLSPKMLQRRNISTMPPI